ncbi:MAG: hypothetical protein ACFE7R_05550 [Candidatus Hodarchaeota archaeon]
MELGTFGAVLKFAMDLETKALSFYGSATEVANDNSLASNFDSLFQRGEKRLKTLERVRRENTTEMILEPITGLNPEDYELEISITKSMSKENLQKIAVAIEDKLRKYYTDAATKIEFLIEAASVFEQLADENEEAAEGLS